jgi:hypothetical protein
MFRKLQPLVLLAFLTLSEAGGAADLVVDGVPLPSDASVAATTPGSAFQQWSGVWVGMWGSSPKHILLVESISEDGTARVVYAIGDSPYAGIQPRWLRFEGIVSGRTLKVTGQGFSSTYEMADDGSLKARFERGANASSATMTRADLASLTRPDTVVAWTRGKFEFLQADLIEDGKPVRLDVVIFRPAGAGSFPLAVINHGSTGRGANPSLFTQTWFATDLADFLSDIDAAITALRRRQDIIAPTPVLIGGVSRGGVLSIAYAGLHPEQVAGVINFVGGWLGEVSPTASTVNRLLFI